MFFNLSYANEKNTPNPRDDLYFSPGRPLTNEELTKARSSRSLYIGSLPSIEGLITDEDFFSTYSENFLRWADTYVKCHYRTHTNAKRMESTYQWALDASGGYYKIYGFWVSNNIISTTDMFFTETNHHELQQICKNTLTQKNIKSQLVMISAGNNDNSYNHAIWNFNQPITAGKFDRLISLGDSLSDTENMYNGSSWTIPNSKYWFLGRFSNGKVWVEYLSESLNIPLHNWSTGGAAADTVIDNLYIVPGVLQQAKSWENYTRHDFNYSPNKTLFTMLIGGNDLIQYKIPVDTIIENQKKSLEILIKNGAKNILVLNLPDVSKAPIFSGRSDVQKIKSEVLSYNEKIKRVVSTIKTEYGSNLKIKLFDFYALFDDLLARPQYYGFKNVNDSCVSTSGIEPKDFFSDATFLEECTDPTEYIFWDKLHPTTDAHRTLSDYVRKFIEQNF